VVSRAIRAGDSYLIILRHRRFFVGPLARRFLSSLIETRMIRRSVVRIWRRKTTYLEESDFKMIPNEEALNREGSSFPEGQT
jgi:hypothetical protein